MTEPTKKELMEAPVKFLAKKGCKVCYERGFVTRTVPLGKDKFGKKKMSAYKTLCPCVTEIKEPEPDECVVPKLAKDLEDAKDFASGVMVVKKQKTYASTTQPLH
jgi:hypothetical protein